MPKSHESTLFLVEKFDLNGVRMGDTLVFRTRAKAREYTTAKNAKSRKVKFKVRVAKWGPAA